MNKHMKSKMVELTKSYIKYRGYPPTYRELAKYLGEDVNVMRMTIVHYCNELEISKSVKACVVCKGE